MWTGGDTHPCDGTMITNDPRYPNAGTFTISMTKTYDGRDAVRLVRTGYGYLFSPIGLVYQGTGSSDGDEAREESASRRSDSAPKRGAFKLPPGLAALAVAG